MKTGLFGGSFNPIHTGHLIVIDQAMEQLGLDQIIVMPAACNPDKMGSTDMADPERRLAMVRLAIGDLDYVTPVHPAIDISRMEIDRGAPSYTIDTVRQLKKNGSGEIVLIIGADSYQRLPYWREAEELTKLVTFGVAHRRYMPLPAAHDPMGMGIHNFYRLVKTTTIDIPTFDTSGTEVRSRIKEGRSIRYLVPEVVEKYIRDNGLYLTSK